MNDPYLKQLIDDLGRAEMQHRGNIENLRNPFRTDGDERLENSQANVDRMHKLISEYLLANHSQEEALDTNKERRDEQSNNYR